MRHLIRRFRAQQQEDPHKHRWMPTEFAAATLSDI
jgi:hypothetical protein